MRATLLLAESLRRRARHGPISITIGGAGAQDVVRLTSLQAGEISNLLFVAVEAFQRQFVVAMAERRHALATGTVEGDDGQVEDTLRAYPDLLSWLADNQALADVFGPWAMDLDPWHRLMACQALAQAEPDVLDDIDPRWRDGIRL